MAQTATCTRYSTRQQTRGASGAAARWEEAGLVLAVGRIRCLLAAGCAAIACTLLWPGHEV